MDFEPIDKKEEMRKNQKGEISASEAGWNPREHHPQKPREKKFQEEREGPTMSDMSKDEDED